MKKQLQKAIAFFSYIRLTASNIRLASVRVNIISLLPQAKISRRAQLYISLGLLYINITDCICRNRSPSPLQHKGS